MSKITIDTERLDKLRKEIIEAMAKYEHDNEVQHSEVDDLAYEFLKELGVDILTDGWWYA